MSAPVNRSEPASQRRRLIVLWQRFGPYHYARLSATARTLAAEGWELVAVQVSDSDEYEWSATAGEGGCRVVTLFPDRGYRDLSRKEIALELDRVFAEIDPAAVAINGWSVPEAVAAADWCRSRRCPAILMCGTHQPAGTKRWWKEAMKWWRVRRFDRATASGRWHAEYLTKLGMPRDRISIGYDVVDNGYFAEEAARVRSERVVTRAQLDLPEDYFFVNTRFLTRKNVDGILRAFARWRTQESELSADWQVVISGSGEKEREWKTLAQELGLADHIQWRGFVQYEQLPAFYALARAFVHVAHFEAWGLVLNEAAAVGLPIIAGDQVGSTCELVKDGENGWLVDSRNDEALAAALHQAAVMNDQERAAFGERSREIVESFGPSRFGRAIQSALQSM